MKDNEETKGLITPPPRWVSAQLLYIVSLHDSDHDGVVRISVALSCELWGYFVALSYKLWGYFVALSCKLWGYLH